MDELLLSDKAVGGGVDGGGGAETSAADGEGGWGRLFGDCPSLSESSESEVDDVDKLSSLLLELSSEFEVSLMTSRGLGRFCAACGGGGGEEGVGAFF